jgi:hypothetical protein
LGCPGNTPFSRDFHPRPQGGSISAYPPQLTKESWPRPTPSPPTPRSITTTLRSIETQQAPAAFDWACQILGVLALAGLTFGLIEGGAHGFGSLLVIVTLVIAVASRVGFVLVEDRIAHPMMPLQLFGSSGMRIALAIGFAFMVGWYGTVFVGSLYPQQQLGLPPLLAGLAFLPSALFAVVGNLLSAPVTNRYGTRVPIVAGLSSMVGGLVEHLPPDRRRGRYRDLRRPDRDRTHFIAGLQTSLTIAAVLLLATVAISVRIRPTDHERRLSPNQPKEKH